MTENAFTSSKTTSTDTTTTELADHATWAINSLIEAGQDELAADFAATYAVGSA